VRTYGSVGAAGGAAGAAEAAFGGAGGGAAGAVEGGGTATEVDDDVEVVATAAREEDDGREPLDVGAAAAEPARGAGDPDGEPSPERVEPPHEPASSEPATARARTVARKRSAS
jgi:hypothetical protein